MRIIIATLVVITVALGLVATSANAFDPNTFWEEQQLQGGGGS
jgi:hypothetical protein